MASNICGLGCQCDLETARMVSAGHDVSSVWGPQLHSSWLLTQPAILVKQCWGVSWHLDGSFRISWNLMVFTAPQEVRKLLVAEIQWLLGLVVLVQQPTD